MRLKTLYFLLVFLCAFLSGNATNVASAIQRNVTKDLRIIVNSCPEKVPVKRFKAKPVSKEDPSTAKSSFIKIHKKKALQVDIEFLPVVFTDRHFVQVSTYEDRFYGLTILYEIARHTYLHLYQLY